jgi:hypothetical protein
MLAEPTGQGSALVAWRDRSVSMADTDAFVQMIGCCRGYQPDIYPWPPRPFRGIPVGYPLLPEHLPFTLPARRGESGYFGFLGVPQLANIPGVAVPGGLTTPDMPRPDWVRITFSDLQRDFTIELFTHQGVSVARAETVQVIEPLASGTVTKQLTFRPTHKGVYILGIGYEGTDYSPGERHLVRVGVAFGDDPPRKRKKGRVSRAGRRKKTR